MLLPHDGRMAKVAAQTGAVYFQPLLFRVSFGEKRQFVASGEIFERLRNTLDQLHGTLKNLLGK